MHSKTNNAIAIAICLFAILVSSCKKEIASTAMQNTSLSQPSLATDAGSTQTVILQPGPTEGEDAFVNLSTNDTAAANTSYGNKPELPIAAWKNKGNVAHLRTYIKFKKLASVIPAGATIVEAKLKLFGLNPNTSVVLPQGNSVYPGSPYITSYPDNDCYILRVTEHDWTEKTITWNNKPACSQTVADTIPASTSQWNYNITADVTNLVRKMVGTGKNNYGFCILLRNEKIYRSVDFSSSEASDHSKWPALAIKYTVN